MKAHRNCTDLLIMRDISNAMQIIRKENKKIFTILFFILHLQKTLVEYSFSHNSSI